ncbi:MAG: carboxypeptidase regulatory-like domain-containing protein, partial [Methanomassiliicoccales archaeon]|nr:carboxypeptidase regulatory-like domain-containing protein [Methanomassiliicoccales archaeon]
ASTTFRIDLVAPSAPTVVQPGRYVSTGRISLTWGPASDNESGVSGYQVRVNRTYYNGTEYVTDIGPWTEVGLVLSYVSTGNEDGWYNVSVRARDRSGNLGPWEVAQLVLDTEPPRAVGYQPLGQSVGTSPVVVIQFSEPMARSSVSLEMGVGGSVAWEGDTVMRFTPSIALNYNSTYTVVVNGRDLAGNGMTSLLWQFTTIPNLGEVRGKVVDERGAPIQGALVSLESGQTEATDQFGEFSIDAPSGVHTLTIRYDGYNEIRLNVTLVAGASLDLGQTALSQSTTDFSWVIILTFVLLVAVAIELVYLRKKRKG